MTSSQKPFRWVLIAPISTIVKLCEKKAIQCGLQKLIRKKDWRRFASEGGWCWWDKISGRRVCVGCRLEIALGGQDRAHRHRAPSISMQPKAWQLGLHPNWLFALPHSRLELTWVSSQFKFLSRSARVSPLWGGMVMEGNKWLEHLIAMACL